MRKPFCESLTKLYEVFLGWSLVPSEIADQQLLLNGSVLREWELFQIIFLVNNRRRHPFLGLLIISPNDPTHASYGPSNDVFRKRGHGWWDAGRNIQSSVLHKVGPVKSATLLWGVYDIHAGQCSWPVSKEHLKLWFSTTICGSFTKLPSWGVWPVFFQSRTC